MPFVNVYMRKGKSEQYRREILDSLYQAMRETFNAPENDRFMVVTELDAANMIVDETYLGIERGPDAIIVQITANNTRDADTKKAFFARAASCLAERPGLRKEDVFLSLVEVPKGNWSFGNGVAQYAV